MLRFTLASASYALLAFVAGFALAIIRVPLLEPNVGPLTAVLIEAPFILILSWLACRVVLRRYGAGGSTPLSLAGAGALGGVALLLLLLAELTLSLLMGKSLSAFGQALVAPAGLLGLGLQLVFASFPIVQTRQAHYAPMPPDSR
jgi:hypothetical protein